MHPITRSLIAVAIIALSVTAIAANAGAAAIPTRHLGAKGGTVTMTATVRSASVP
jgi:hypothetical protein